MTIERILWFFIIVIMANVVSELSWRLITRISKKIKDKKNNKATNDNK